MGAGAARITAADFVTPPEFRGYELAADGTGQVGGVRLALASDGPATRLTSCYQQVPLRVLPPLALGGAQPVLVYLMTLAPGLMDGDGHLVEVAAGPGTRALLTGQSATRIHPGLRSFATQQWRIRVGSGAVLVVLPGPAVPFGQARSYQRVRVDLDAGAGFVWGDIWFAGRYARGRDSEQFRFDRLIQDLVVWREGEVVFRDRFAWRGPWDQPTAAWHFGLAPPPADADQVAVNPACASLFVTGEVRGDPDEDRWELPSAVFRTARGDTCLRWCGPSEAVVRSTVRTALRAAAGLCPDPPAAWLLAGHGLAPTHWFTDMSLPQGRP